MLSFLLEAVILGGIFHAVYGIFWGWPGAETMTIAHKISLSTAQSSVIQNINKTLLIMFSYFTLMLAYHSITQGYRFKSEKDLFFFTNHILPFIAYAFGFTYLIGCYFYLQDYPRQIHLDFMYTVSGILYISHTLFTTGRTMYFLSYSLRSESAGLGPCSGSKQPFALHTVVF